MTARKFAEGTTVPTEKSRHEIEQMITRHGADMFAYMHAPGRAQIQFRFKQWHIRFGLPLPAQDDKQFARTPGRGKQRTADQRYVAWDAECRRRWRSLALAVKAKLECVASGITTFEQEFLAHIVDPATNKTVGDVIMPQLTASYEGSNGSVPLLLEGPKE